jgi:broad specificity phosphatase PhoE
MYQNPYIKLAPLTRKPYTEILLIRHCHPDYSQEKKVGERNMPLSKAGLKQRSQLTKHLLKLDIDKIYVSGLVRAQETAFEYAALAKKEVILDERLDEIDWTDWCKIKYFNTSEKTREKKLKNHARLDRQLDKMQTVARRALADIFRRGKGKNIAIFSHGNFIKALLTGILNADVIGFLSLEIFQSSISKLVIDRDGYIKIAYINDASHLPEPPDKDMFITLKD